MMKKSTRIISLILSVSILLSLTTGLDFLSYAANVSKDRNYEYNILDDGTAEITDYNGSAEVLEIPSTIDKYTVTRISSSAFFDGFNIESITIPESITKIGEGAFSYCAKLSSINVNENNAYYSSQDGVLFNKDKTILVEYPMSIETISYIIPDGVTDIANSAFYNCSRLTSITIPDSVTSIGDFAFYECNHLKNITLPDGVITIGNYVFSLCKRLENIVLPDNLVSIGDYAFLDCRSLGSITLPDSLTSIGDYAFRECSNLTNIVIPESVISMAESAFYECSNLVNINVDANNTYYCSQNGVLFDKDKTLLIIYPVCRENNLYAIPSTVTRIADYAFYKCKNLVNVIIPDDLISVGDFAFYECRNLTNMIIPDSVISIGYGAFKSCDKIFDIYYKGTEKQWNEMNVDIINTGLSDVNIHYNCLIVANNKFSDIQLSNFVPYSDYVMYTSVYNNYINGTNPPYFTEFSPNQSITRAMFVTILYRMAGEPYKNANHYKSSPFSDIKDKNVYYYDAACWALDKGITTEKTFRPNDLVVREQTAAFLFRYADIEGYVDDSYETVNLEAYPDYDSVSKWAVPAMQWANQQGMITGTQQGELNPKGSTQRIHASKILYGFGKTCNIGNIV